MNRKLKCKRIKSTEPTVQYKSSKRLFDLILYEYNYEYERFKGFQNRTGLLFPFVTALTLLLFQNSNIFKFKEILAIKIESIGQGWIYILLIVLYGFTILALFLSVYFSLKVFSVEKFERPGYEIFDPNNGLQPEDVVEMAFLAIYLDSLKHAGVVNNKKTKQYNRLIYSIIISISLVSIISIFNSFVFK